MTGLYYTAKPCPLNRGKLTHEGARNCTEVHIGAEKYEICAVVCTLSLPVKASNTDGIKGRHFSQFSGLKRFEML